MNIREEIYDIISPYIKMHNDAVACSYGIKHYLKSQIEQMENPILEYIPADKVSESLRAKARGYDEAIQDILSKLQ